MEQSLKGKFRLDKPEDLGLEHILKLCFFFNFILKLIVLYFKIILICYVKNNFLKIIKILV